MELKSAELFSGDCEKQQKKVFLRYLYHFAIYNRLIAMTSMDQVCSLLIHPTQMTPRDKTLRITNVRSEDAISDVYKLFSKILRIRNSKVGPSLYFGVAVEEDC
jgi:hypothetical protein